MAVSRRGQGSVEFLYAVLFSLLFFGVTIVIYLSSQADAGALYEAASMRRVCLEIASQVSSVASAGDGTRADLDMPEFTGSQQWGAYVSGGNFSISVYSGGASQACKMSTSLVSNGTASSFPLPGNATLENVGGTVYFRGG